MAISAPDKVLGAGRLYFSLYDSDTQTFEPKRYMGNTPGFTISIETETLEFVDSDNQVAVKEDEITTRLDRNASITCNNVSDENLALFLVANVATLSQASGTATVETITALSGRFYQLGVTAQNPTGVRNISNVTVEDAGGGGTTYVEGTDYAVNASAGWVEILAGGGIADAASLDVTYDNDQSDRTQITSDAVQPRSGELHYLSDNTRGPNRDLYAPFVEMRPNGELPFKSRDTWMEMSFNTTFITRPGFAPLYLDGRPVAGG